MKRLVLIALSLACAAAALAAEPAKPMLFDIREEVANPAMVPQYESATKDLVKLFNDGGPSVSASYRFTTFMTNDLHYVYLLPLANYAALDRMNDDWMNAGKTFGNDRWMDIMKRNANAMTSYNDTVVMYRPDLSYEPSDAAMQQPYARVQFYYLRPGAEQQAEQVARDYATLFRSKNIPNGFRIYMAQTGMDLPLLVAVIPAKSASDWTMADEKNNATLGDALKALQMRAMSISRRIESKEIWARPDLSYMGPMQAASK